MDTSEVKTVSRAIPVLLAPGDWWISNPGTGLELVQISFDGGILDEWDKPATTPTSETYSVAGGIWIRPVNDVTLIYRQASADSVSYYTNRTLLDYMYGRQNIREWADLDNEKEETALIYSRIESEILNVQEFINGHLCHLYDTPFDPVPRVIQQIATALTGHRLRDARVMNEDDDGLVLRKYEMAMQDLRHIKDGAIRLPNLKAHTMGSIAGFIGV